MRMPPLPADFIHARACKLKCEKILTRPLRARLVRRVRLVHRVQKERQAFKALLVLMEKLQQSRLVP